MTPLAWTVVLSAVATAGVALVVSGWAQPAPSLPRTLARLSRLAPSTRASEPSGRRSVRLDPIVQWLLARPRLLPSSSELQLVGRSPEQHVLYLVVAALLGFVTPLLLVGGLQAIGLLGVRVAVPLVLALAGAAAGPVLVHLITVSEAEEVHADFRYQVSAYLDVVTMLLAGNSGYEGALEQAAAAGDGRLFVALRRRMRDSAARGNSLTAALEQTGRDYGLDELEQIAATAALSAAEGAPVAKTLAAKCATLRSALATDQESEARLRTSRLTTPIVGMALIFMALVMYPALSST